VKDEPSNPGDKKRPEWWPATIPDDFIWDPENECWYAPGEPCTFDIEAFSRELDEVIQEVKKSGKGGGPVAVPELWDALDAEREGRKRKKKSREARSESQTRLLWDDDATGEDEQSAPADSEGSDSQEDDAAD
jgi:hypothetical protein